MLKVLGLYLEIFVILGIPVVLMGSSSAALAGRQLITVVGGLYCYLILRHYKAKLADIGLTLRNFRQSFMYLITPSLGIIALALTLIVFIPDNYRLWLIGSDPLRYSPMWSRLAIYIFTSAPLQEFIFRGYFTYRLERIVKNDYWLLTLSILVFTIAHIPFRSPMMIVVSLFMGITYIFNYQKYRNLYTIMISHAVVGSILMLVRNFYLPYT